MRPAYAEICNIHCTDNNTTLEVDILNFKPEAFLDVSIKKSIKVKLKYDPQPKVYVGSVGGYEFTTKGPKKL